MIFLYFSGTGNSKYIAELFCKKMNVTCHSIEDEVDFAHLISSETVIGFCYPIYGSRVPRIMREFVSTYRELLEKKKLIIFCTQMIPVCDGTRAFTDLFQSNSVEVIYAERFTMPNNINNVPLFPLSGEKGIKKSLAKAEKKMQVVCENIEKGVVVKRGFDIFSRTLGSFQGALLPFIENVGRKGVRINESCNKCQLCVSSCPMKNFNSDSNMITTNDNCTLCFRCINKCPKKAISILRRRKVKQQYKGV